MDLTRSLNQLIKKEKENGTIITKEISDGHHSFGELYEQRAVLFCTICNMYPDISWKSRKHYDDNDPMYNGDFIAGIYTPMGQAAFHLKDKYWDKLHVSTLDKAPKYDGYDADEALFRIESLGDLVGLISEEKRNQR